MTLPSSGPLSLQDINNEFGRGANLNAYRGTPYFFPGNINQYYFPSGTISISNFYGTQANNPVTPGSQSFTAAGASTFTVPLFNTMTVQIWGGGGSGGSGYNGNVSSQGGQGGSYVSYSITPGQIVGGGTYNVYVGAGGATIYTGGGAGNYGIYSWFAQAIWAIGGYGGLGQFAGTNYAPSYTPTVSVPWTQIASEVGGGGGYNSAGGSTTYAGGGGGGGRNSAYYNQAGGSSTYGGAGGYGAGPTINAQDGFQPGGGGGGSVNHSGAGATGRVTISWT